MARRVALLPASAKVRSTPLFSSITPGMQHYNATVDRLAAEHGVGDEDPLDSKPVGKRKPPRSAKSRRKRKKPTSPEFVITKADERLLEEATRLQDLDKRKRKFKLSNFTKKPSKSIKRKVRAGGASKVPFSRRTTLLSLMRRMPDAKKPLSTWLK